MANTSTTGPLPGASDAPDGVTPYKMTAGGPGTGQTCVTYAGTITNPAGSTALGSAVPAGKTLFITDIIITVTVASQTLVSLMDNATVVFNAHANSTKGIEAPGLETQPVVASGDTLNINSTFTGTLAYFISGFIQ